MRHLADVISKSRIFLNNYCILSPSSLTFFIKVKFTVKSALAQVMARRRKGDMPLPAPMIMPFIYAICSQQAKWVKSNSYLAISFFTKGQMENSSWWRHQMETFSALLALCEGNHRSPVTGGFPSQRPVAQSFGIFFEQAIDTPVIWDPIASIMTSL